MVEIRKFKLKQYYERKTQKIHFAARSSQSKGNVSIEAIREYRTFAELSEKHEVSAEIISRLKMEFLEKSSTDFWEAKRRSEMEVDTEKLYALIGQLKVKNGF